MFEKIRDRDILVIGLARSGLAAVKLLAKLGASRIVVNDSKSLDQLEKAAGELRGVPGVQIEAGGHPPALANTDISLVVKSPGVNPNLEIFARARALNIPIISEVELAYHFIRSPIIGITGTNGKTTTTMLTAEIFKGAGWNRVMAVGNIGLPFCQVVDDADPYGLIVAELSSFQLEDIIDFRPWISVILNISEDHLDYHGTMENYINAKRRILENQSVSDMVILNADDPVVLDLKAHARGRLLFFSREKKVEGFVTHKGQLGLWKEGVFYPVCGVDEISIILENALAASTAAWAGGADLESIGRTLKQFKGVPHRMEMVRVIDGVTFVNDSKGTNTEACRKALNTYPGKKILIAGGKDKGADFTSLAGAIKEKVRFLILLGETAPLIAEAVEKAGFSSWERADSLDEAVALAWNRAAAGDIVLLSPACASWDMFSNFEERGDRFKEMVFNLPGQGNGGGE